MNMLFFITFAFLGLIIGSFLGVVIDRYNTGFSFSGRSMCLSCNKNLSWYELVPFFSFIYQKGKCLSCKTSIPKRIFFIEIITASLFVLIAYKYFYLFFANITIFIIIFLITAIIFSFLIAILFYDLRHFIIPDRFVYGFIFVSIISLFIDPNTSSLFVLPSFFEVIYPILFTVVLSLVWFLTKGKYFGFGDVKLLLGVSLFLGFFDMLSSLLVAVWIGAIVSVILLLFFSKKFSLKSEIPFAPYIVLGTIIVWFFGITIFDIMYMFV